MASINYVIATSADALHGRIRDPFSLLILRYHLKILSSILKTDGLIKQVTIVRQDSKIENHLRKEYYKIEEYVEEIRKKNLKVEILDVEKLGISYTQYLLAYEKFPHFDYYMIMEDDWVINKKYKDFDHLLLGLYSKCFPSGSGFLDCWSPRSGKYVGPNGGFKNYPHHSCISVGLLDNASIKKISEKAKSREERENLAQLEFSLAATDQGIEIMDLPTAGLKTQILFWRTNLNTITDYTETKEFCNPVFVPIQFYYKNVILSSPDNLQRIHLTNEDILEQTKLFEKIKLRMTSPITSPIFVKRS